MGWQNIALWQCFNGRCNIQLSNFASRNVTFTFLFSVFCLIPLVKLRKIAKNPIFQTLEFDFRLLGGVFQKCSNCKYYSIHQKKLPTIFSVKNTPLTFFAFFSPYMSIFLKKF